VVFHVLHNSLLLGVFWLEMLLKESAAPPVAGFVRALIVGLCAVLSFGLLWRLWHQPPPAPVETPSPEEAPLEALPAGTVEGPASADELVP
jgi:hypothetical protein